VDKWLRGVQAEEEVGEMCEAESVQSSFRVHLQRTLELLRTVVIPGCVRLRHRLQLVYRNDYDDHINT